MYVLNDAKVDSIQRLELNKYAYKARGSESVLVLSIPTTLSSYRTDTTAINP